MMMKGNKQLHTLEYNIILFYASYPSFIRKKGTETNQ